MPQQFYSSGHFIEVVTNEILCYHSNVCMKRCIQNNIFMLKADYMNIIIFGGLGCIWCHLSIGKCITLRGQIKGKSRDTNLMYP